jgi:hypothetical protein
MKKALYRLTFILILIFSVSNIGKSQVGNTGWSGIKKLGIVPQDNPDFVIEAFKQLSCNQGEDQWGEITIKNNSSKRYRIECTVVIVTICGNEETLNKFTYLNAKNGIGNSVGFTAWIHAKQCNGTKFKDSDGFDQYDRIKSVSFKNFTYKEAELDK